MRFSFRDVVVFASGAASREGRLGEDVTALAGRRESNSAGERLVIHQPSGEAQRPAAREAGQKSRERRQHEHLRARRPGLRGGPLGAERKK